MSARPRGGLNDFYFQAYIPGSGAGDPKIDFEAHIVALNDSSSPSWNEEFDMGRADPTMFYASMNRNITISFMVVAVSKEEHKINYTKLSELGTLTYPIYQAGQGYNAPHTFYKIGDHLSGIGVITNLDYTWSPDHPWAGEQLRPVITEVGMSIRVLTDSGGNRPIFDGGKYKYFG